MEQENQDFEPLRKLLSLKKHEQPPPRFFNEFSGNVISKIRAQRSEANVMHRLESEAPWLLRFWQTLSSKPAVAWGFGAAVYAVFLGGILLAKKPAAQPELTGSPTAADTASLVAAQGAGGGAGINQPVLMQASNSSPVGAPNLFELFQPVQTAPVSAPR
jgi:hypothetical protein